MKIIHAKQTPWGWLVSGLLVFALLLSACANITAQVALVEPVIEETGYEKFDLKNCEEAALVWSSRPVATLTLLGMAPNSDCCPARVASDTFRQFSCPAEKSAPSEVMTLSRAQICG